MTVEHQVLEVQAMDAAAAAVEPLIFRSFGEQASPEEPTLSVEEELQPPFDLQASLQAAQEEARREVLALAEHRLQAELADERRCVTRLVQQFEQEKRRYFADVEKEVVKLSLAIAERVLHREAEMDPMLLAGAARVALEQVAEDAEAVLRVSPGEVERWNETLRPAAPKGMVIQPDEALPRGECVLKTRSGTLQLGLRAQLQEIERGFFELLGRRPAVAV